MKAFNDSNFILETATAQHLYHDYAAKMPLCDYHCHLNPREIYEDRRFNNIVEVWLGGQNPDGSYAGDHYKWRLMRSNGVEERYVTGGEDHFARSMKLVEALEMAIGNPMYHWCHLELQQFFGVYEPLTVESAKRIWDHCNELLRNDPDMTAREAITASKELMRGNKLRLFCLNLSFIGWAFLCLAPLLLLGGIAAGPLFMFTHSNVEVMILLLVGTVISSFCMLFVGAYAEASIAAFYREICREKNPPQDPFQPESTPFETYQMPYQQMD